MIHGLTRLWDLRGPRDCMNKVVWTIGIIELIGIRWEDNRKTKTKTLDTVWTTKRDRSDNIIFDISVCQRESPHRTECLTGGWGQDQLLNISFQTNLWRRTPLKINYLFLSTSTLVENKKGRKLCLYNGYRDPRKMRGFCFTHP